MKKKHEPLDLEGFDLDAIDFKIDLLPNDFDFGELRDVDSLNGLLDSNLDGIGT